ncbi:hypothetical protein [Actinoplanes octamycinicus]|uniref:hypothetical protein n=1 Tax=Actinoplanes octamycinicus TaxID=135948 RepID=UPI0035E55BC5
MIAYRRAEWGSGGQFDWFWAGMLIFTLPVGYWALRRSASPRLRLAVLVGYAAFTYLPKLLRHPSGPLYHDEYAHWGQSHEILLDGRLFAMNPIVRVIGDYPGLHACVASLAALTGLSIWQAALIVLTTAHVLLTLGVAVLAGQLWPDPRIAAAAALGYSLNSSFLFFDTQLGYESLAIAVLVWALAAALRAMHAGTVPARLGWAALTLLLAAATTATHHLTALWMTGVLGLLALAATVHSIAARELITAARVAWALTSGTALIVATWLGVVAPRTGSYLDPYLGRALDQFSGLAGGEEGGRELFSKSVLPWWEQTAAYVAPGVALLAFAGAAGLWWRRRYTDEPLTRTGTTAMLLLGALYFPATLLILTPAGAEGARRSWAFSYLGLAVAVAPVVVAVLDKSRQIRLGRLAAVSRMPRRAADPAGRANARADFAGRADARVDSVGRADARADLAGRADARADFAGRADARVDSVGRADARLDSAGHSPVPAHPGGASPKTVWRGDGISRGWTVDNALMWMTGRRSDSDHLESIGSDRAEGRLGAIVAGGALLAVCALLLVGNNAAGMNPSYRFPGPPVYGSDTRAATPEVLAAAHWLRDTQGRGVRLVADRYSGLILGSYGEQQPTTGSASFPAYDLYRVRPGQPMPPALLAQLRAWRFEFLVVDRRMAEQVPDINIYFETNEPLRHDGVPAFDRAQLTKFDSLPWLIKIYDGPHLAIYRFDFGSLDRVTAAGWCPGVSPTGRGTPTCQPASQPAQGRPAQGRPAQGQPGPQPAQGQPGPQPAHGQPAPRPADGGQPLPRREGN